MFLMVFQADIRTKFIIAEITHKFHFYLLQYIFKYNDEK